MHTYKEVFAGPGRSNEHCLWQSYLPQRFTAKRLPELVENQRLRGFFSFKCHGVVLQRQLRSITVTHQQRLSVKELLCYSEFVELSCCSSQMHASMSCNPCSCRLAVLALELIWHHLTHDEELKWNPVYLISRFFLGVFSEFWLCFAYSD